MARQRHRGNRRRRQIRQDRRSQRSPVFPPTDVDELIGDAKARQKLGWTPKTTFAQLVKEMVAGDLAIARREVANGSNPV
jgi:GDP-D-mannose dehydratase